MEKRVADLETLGADVAQQLSEFGPARAVALERARRAFLEARPAREPAGRRLVLSSLSVAALGVIVALYTLLRAPSTLTFQVDGKPGSVEAWLAAPPARPVDVHFSDGTTLRLQNASRARVIDVGRDGARIALESGALHAKVIHTQKSAWWLVAGPLLVRVTGTRFDLEWDPSSQQFSIAVREGSVGVSGSIVGAERPVRAGESLHVSVADLGLELVRAQERAPRAATPPPASASPDDPRASPANDNNPASPVGSSSDAGLKKPRVSGWRELAQRGALREAFAAAEASGFRDAYQSATPAELLVLGDAARLAGRADRVNEALSFLRQRYPRDPRRAAAAFTLGKVAFDQRHAYEQAASWFSICVREQPTGSLSREASGRLVEAWRAAGNSSAARQAAQAYVERYPDGPHAKLARSLLE
jgi:TolA-binding protein